MSSSSSSGKRRFARIDRLHPYVFNITAELKLAARRRGEDIIDLSMGNPDGATPAHIVAKLTEVAQRPDTHGYSASKGIPRLRRAISHWYKDRYAVDIDPDSEAIVTIGSKEGLAHLMLATLDRGDTVLVPDPSYPIHIYGAVIAGADIRSVPLVPGVDFFAELEKTPLTLELLNRDVARVALIIARNIDIKRAVVVADERETNQRKLLNFGHSAGHAVEACEHFELGHGNCVSIGMGIITRAAALHGICDAALPARIEELCARHGLKTRCDLSADAIFAEALHDKKRAGDTIDLVIPHDIGRCSIDRTPLSTFHDLIAEGLGQKGDASAC